MPVESLNSKDEFDAFISKNKLVAIDFFATWCGPCKIIGPKFVEFSDVYTAVKFAKVDVDNADDVSSECGITAMPTFQFYKDGHKVEEIKGANAAALEEILKKLVA